MDRLDAMIVLVAVAEEGSLSAAARRLRSPLATVSRKVADLERHLRARLFVRTSRHLELTDAGRGFVASARRILGQVEEAESTANGEYREARGSLAVTASVDLGHRVVAPIVTEFLSSHPLVKVGLHLTDRVVHLVEERVDVAIRVGDIDSANFVATRVGDVRLVTVASPSYLERAGVPRHPDELRLHDCIVMADGTANAGAVWRYQGGDDRLVVDPRQRMAVSLISPAVAAASAGLGLIQTLSCNVRGALHDGSLVTVLDDFAPPPLPVRIVYPSRELMPVKTRSFIDFIGPRLRAHLTRDRAEDLAAPALRAGLATSSAPFRIAA